MSGALKLNQSQPPARLTFGRDGAGRHWQGTEGTRFRGAARLNGRLCALASMMDHKLDGQERAERSELWIKEGKAAIPLYPALLVTVPGQ